jgi:hypothetical protein
VAGLFTGEGVGDFVEEGFADLRFVVVGDEVGGELDALFAVAAKAKGAFAAVPGEGPVVEMVVLEELVSEVMGGGKIHGAQDDSRVYDARDYSMGRKRAVKRRWRRTAAMRRAVRRCGKGRGADFGE